MTLGHKPLPRCMNINRIGGLLLTEALAQAGFNRAEAPILNKLVLRKSRRVSIVLLFSRWDTL